MHNMFQRTNIVQVSNFFSPLSDSAHIYFTVGDSPAVSLQERLQYRLAKVGILSGSLNNSVVSGEGMYK